MVHDMKANIIDGKALAAATRAEIAKGVAELKAKTGTVPGLAVILVGENPASISYVTAKEKASAEAGMMSREIRLPADVPEAELLDLVTRLGADPAIHGILVQLPLPEHICETTILSAIDHRKDVDGLTPENVGRTVQGLPSIISATPRGIRELLARYNIQTEGKAEKSIIY